MSEERIFYSDKEGKNIPISNLDKLIKESVEKQKKEKKKKKNDSDTPK